MQPPTRNELARKTYFSLRLNQVAFTRPQITSPLAHYYHTVNQFRRPLLTVA